MRKFHVLVHSLLIVTPPSLLAYPQYEQPTIQRDYNQEKPYENFNLTYDEILCLLQDIEEERLENLTEEKSDKITQFIVFLAGQGMLPGDYAINAELENDIVSLFVNDHKFYDYVYAANSFDEYIIHPIALNAKDDPMSFICKNKQTYNSEKLENFYKSVFSKTKDELAKAGYKPHNNKHKKDFFKKIKDFISKHRKAIIIGAAIVVGVTTIIIAVTAASSVAVAAAVKTAEAAGAAAALKSAFSPDKDNSSLTTDINSGITAVHEPTLKSTIDSQIVIFKENLMQNQFFQPPNPSLQQGLSWEESGRTLGSLFAHNSYNNIQCQLFSYPRFSKEIQDINSYSRWNQSIVVGHSEIDHKFTTDLTHLYRHPDQDVDFNSLSYQVRGESALAHRCYEQAAQDFEKAIELNPINSILYLERGVANFGLGKYDESLFDYQQFASQDQKANFLSIPDFSLGFAKGLPKGMYESGRGILAFLSDVVTHPLHTGGQMWDALKLLSDLASTEQWETLSEVLAPEVHQLVKEWDIIPSEKRGELAGYVFGKYGADILIPGVLAKTVSKGVKGAQELSTVYRGLKTAEQTFLLESAASLESSAKIAEVVHLEKQISNWLGEGTQFVRNKAEDPIFLSKDGLRKVRFDFNRPHPHESPHLHFEHFIDGEWKEVSRVYPIDVLHK